MEEVHLWRGTPEQRALRSSCRRFGQFRFFDQQLGHPDWTGRTVLDFGGNQGNLLVDSNDRICPRDYYCVDVIREAIDEGRKQFPEAHWVHYNRYNCSFNPEGSADVLIPELRVEFDYILAYSVFTHIAREEMHDLVGQLRARLKPSGTLAFTFIDPHRSSWPATYAGNNLLWRLESARGTGAPVDVDGLLEKGRGAAWCALVDGTELHVEGGGIDGPREATTYHVFYTAAFLQQEFPDARILPPPAGEMQGCCLLGRAAPAP
jgi:2-polyprenyl-3-methyl-5-hydroxy-6-metoxy-1,4-benzoquinol methylase